MTSVPRLFYALDGRTALKPESVLEAVGAKSAHRRYRVTGLRFSRAFEGGLFVSVGPSVNSGGLPPATRCPARSDRLVGARILHRSLQYRRLAPYMGYANETGRSGRPVHEYRNHGANSGVTEKF